MEDSMAWMALIMGLPVLGLALFSAYPWPVALTTYLILVCVSGFFDCLMMRAMRLPARCGREEMVGSTAAVLEWNGDAGRVICHGEIWQARTSVPERGTVFRKGQRLVIRNVTNLTVFVEANDN